MLYKGQKVNGFTITVIDRPVGEETWVHPPGWVMVLLMGPEDQFVILNLPPEDQALDKLPPLLHEELESRSRWINKELTL